MQMTGDLSCAGHMFDILGLSSVMRCARYFWLFYCEVLFKVALDAHMANPL